MLYIWIMPEEHHLLFETLLKNVSFTREELTTIADSATIRKYKKGQLLMAPGNVLRKTHFVRKGLVIAYYIDHRGQEHLIQFATEGWWISDLKSFVSGEPAAFFVEAQEDCEVYEFGYEQLEITFDKIHAFEKYFLRIIQRAFLTFQERTLQTISLPAIDRYKEFHRKYPLAESRLPQKLIASYIGVTPEFLSRAKKELLFSDK